jgi:hypothetical protein
LLDEIYAEVNTRSGPVAADLAIGTISAIGSDFRRENVVTIDVLDSDFNTEALQEIVDQTLTEVEGQSIKLEDREGEAIGSGCSQSRYVACHWGQATDPQPLFAHLDCSFLCVDRRVCNTSNSN